ncbi:MAG: hypothetical protein RR397_03020 [Odoribacter sp.]
MEKIKLKLCAGTMCYVMGGAQLMEIEDLLSEEEKQYVEITLSPCLQQCKDQATPPFAEVNGELIVNANKQTLLQIIKEELKNVVR